jgi:hypothetical protein
VFFERYQGEYEVRLRSDGIRRSMAGEFLPCTQSAGDGSTLAAEINCRRSSHAVQREHARITDSCCSH